MSALRVTPATARRFTGERRPVNPAQRQLAKEKRERWEHDLEGVIRRECALSGPGSWPRNLRERIEGVRRQVRFDPSRGWRFDFAWPCEKLAVEVEGGIYSGGRHTRGRGFEADCEKYNEAALLGWQVIRVTPNQIKSGEARLWILRGLGIL